MKRPVRDTSPTDSMTVLLPQRSVFASDERTRGEERGKLIRSMDAFQLLRLLYIPLHPEKRVMQTARKRRRSERFREGCV